MERQVKNERCGRNTDLRGASSVSAWRTLALRTVLPVVLTLILFISAIYIIALPSIENSIMTTKKEMIRELANTTWRLLNDYENRVISGELSLEEAQRRAVQRIRVLRYGPDDEDYFWINDMRPYMIMHPYRTDLEGKDLSDFADTEGNLLFVEFVETVEKEGAGYVEYMWQWKSDSTRIVPKCSYIRGFEPWDWIIGTGIYLDDVHAQIGLLTRKLNISFTGIILVVLTLSLIIIMEMKRIEKIRFKAEDSLRSSEQKFRSISSSAMDSIVVINDEGIVTFWNASAEDLFGHSSDEAVDRRLNDLIMPPGGEVNCKGDAGLFESIEEAEGRVEMLEKSVQDRNGKIFPVELTASPAIMEGRRNTVVIMRDVSERKKAETELRESRQRYSLHILQTPLGFIEWDTSFMVIEWNPAAQRIFGYSKEEAIGKHAAEIIVPASAKEHVDGIWEALLQHSGGTRSTNENITKGGRTILCEWYNTPLIDPNGQVIGVASLVQDITEIRNAQEALIRQSAALEQTLDGISIMDLEGRILFVNHSMARMHGYSGKELLGTHFSVFYNKEHMKSDIDPMIERVRKKGSVTGEINHARKDGTVFQARTTINVLRDESGEPAGMILTAQDITERLKLEAQLRQSQKVESIGRLAGGIAHDFNNLLSPILGYSELLMSGMTEEDPAYRELLTIKKAAEGARDLTRQLLAFGRRQVLEIHTVDLGSIVSGFEKILRSTVRENVELVLDLDQGTGKIKADVTQIEMILMNLVLNSMDAMPEGGKITIESCNITLGEDFRETHPDVEQGPYVMLSVKDTGTGIDEATLGKIFEPFFTTKEAGKGTGLGLSTVHGIVRQHNGIIDMHSERGSGTVIRIYFPEVVRDEEKPAVQKVASRGHGGNETIIIVEDNDMVRELVSKVLGGEGYRIIEARDPESSISLAAEHEGNIDMLLSDVIMPGMNGKELYSRLRSKMPDLKVLFMSGYADDVIVHQGALERGVNFIQKPFSNLELVDKVREVLTEVQIN